LEYEILFDPKDSIYLIPPPLIGSSFFCYNKEFYLYGGTIFQFDSNENLKKQMINDLYKFNGKNWELVQVLGRSIEEINENPQKFNFHQKFISLGKNYFI
jgi:hypothetical protein